MHSATHLGAAFVLAATAGVATGVSLPLTGPTSALGIPARNGITLWPDTVAGEKLKVIVLDDATDPTQGVKNAREFVTEDHVDVILGSVATPIAAAIAPVASGRGHAGRAGLPKRAQGRAGIDRPPARLARRSELHADRSLRLYARHRRAADDRRREMEAGTERVTA